MRLTDKEFHTKESKERACYIQEPRLQAIYDKLFNLEDIEEELGIELITLLNTKNIYVANYSYWKRNFDGDKQQCEKKDIGAVEEKRVEEKSRFCVDFINKEIVVIETILASDDFDYETKITRFPFEDYGKTWALTKEELL